MLAWIAALVATVVTPVVGYLAARREEGERAARRVPLLVVATAAAGIGLALVAATTPTEWWNYVLIPGTALEWYGVVLWKRRRAEMGPVLHPLRRLPGRRHLLVLAGLAVLGAVMELRANGLGLTNVVLVLFGMSNVALYLGAERHRPGLTGEGILLLDGFVRWEEVEAWSLDGEDVARLTLRLTRPHPGAGTTLDLEPSGTPDTVGAFVRGVKLPVLLAALLLGGGVARTSAQVRPDSALLRDIEAIRAIDVHAHSRPADDARFEEGVLEDYLESLASTDPAILRIDPRHRDYVLAWQALWGYAADGIESDRVRELAATKAGVVRKQGRAYPAWVLDRAGIETQFVFTPADGPNAILGLGQTPPRFRWAPQASPLVYPFDADASGLRRLLDRAGVSMLPPTLDGYTRGVVVPTLGRWRAGGAVGLKFTLAYQRPLSFADVSEDTAGAIYARYVDGGRPTAAEYTAVQDHLFRFIAREAGRVGLAVFIHTGVGHDDWFDVSGSNPALLEPLFDEPSMRATRFVVVHGGWPHDAEAGVMLQKPNVYADFSVQPLLRSTRALAATLRAWLEWAPEKVMFGTDAYSEAGTPLSNWEEKTWVATHAAREALALALTGMMDDGELTRDQARLIATMVMRENAIRVFGLGEPR